MLAYRMLARGENLLDVVMKAATSRYQFQIVFPDLFYTNFFDILQIPSSQFFCLSRNLKALGLPKDEMKKLGNVFTKEYSGQ